MKPDSSSSSKHQLQIASCLSMGLWAHFHFSVLGFCLVWTCADLYMLSLSLWVHVYISLVLSGKTLFPWRHLPPLTFTIFLPLLPHRSPRTSPYDRAIFTWYPGQSGHMSGLQRLRRKETDWITTHRRSRTSKWKSIVSWVTYLQDNVLYYTVSENNAIPPSITLNFTTQ